MYPSLNIHNQLLYSQLAREKQEKNHQIDVRIFFSTIALEVNNREFYEKLAVIESR